MWVLELTGGLVRGVGVMSEDGRGEREDGNPAAGTECVVDEKWWVQGFVSEAVVYPLLSGLRAW